MYKQWVHEGGISSPLVLRWPERITARRTWIADPGHFIEVMATCVDASGANDVPMQGRSLLPLAPHAARPVERDIFWEHEGNKAIRRGLKPLAAEWQSWADQAGVLPWEQVSKQQHSR
jgi:arylsulfatase A-like enzyme